MVRLAGSAFALTGDTRAGFAAFACATGVAARGAVTVEVGERVAFPVVFPRDAGFGGFGLAALARGGFAATGDAVFAAFTGLADAADVAAGAVAFAEVVFTLPFVTFVALCDFAGSAIFGPAIFAACTGLVAFARIDVAAVVAAFADFTTFAAAAFAVTVAAVVAFFVDGAFTACFAFGATGRDGGAFAGVALRATVVAIGFPSAG